jgi:hypothetical protein
MRCRYLALPVALLAACALDPAVPSDGRGDSFSAGGKADGLIEEGSPEALGVLDVANTVDFDTFVGEPPQGVGLAPEAADHILAYRAGDDGEHGTADDRRFQSLAELDAIDFVGPIALDRLLAFAWSHHFVPVCGDGIVQVGEECDPPGAGGCDDSCRFERTTFRITSLELRDPHPHARVLFFCRDIVDEVNDGVRDAIEVDDRGDGFLDLSALVSFGPLDPSAESTALDVMLGQCTAPASATTCEPAPEAPRVHTTAHNQGEGSCLGVLPGTGGGYSPPVAEPQGPCFASESHSLTVPFGDFEVTLSDAQVAATYAGDASSHLQEGLIRGFLSEAEASAIVLPSDLPVVGGQALSRLLPGGGGNCSSRDDRDLGPDGEMGWYFYLNFEAEVVPFSEPDHGDDDHA